MDLEKFCDTLTPLTIWVDPLSIRTTMIFLGSMLALCCIYIKYSKVIGRLPATLWAYALASGLVIMHFPWPIYRCFHTAFQATAGQAFSELLLIPTAALLLPSRYSAYAWRAIPAMVAFTIFAIWMRWPGFMIAPSLNTAFLAMAWLFLKPNKLGLALMVCSFVTIVFTHGSTAFLILFSQACALAVYGYCGVPRRHLSWRTHLRVGGILSAALGAFIFLAKLHSNSPWFDSSVRLRTWARQLNYWAHFDPVLNQVPEIQWQNIIFGTGLGSFRWMSYMSDEGGKVLTGLSHGDWLKILMDLGAVGLLLTLATLGALAWKCRRDVWPLCGLFSIVACSTTYHPMSFFPTALLSILFLRRAIKCKH